MFLFGHGVTKLWLVMEEVWATWVDAGHPARWWHCDHVDHGGTWAQRFRHVRSSQRQMPLMITFLHTDVSTVALQKLTYPGPCRMKSKKSRQPSICLTSMVPSESILVTCACASNPSTCDEIRQEDRLDRWLHRNILSSLGVSEVQGSFKALGVHSLVIKYGHDIGYHGHIWWPSCELPHFKICSKF